MAQDVFELALQHHQAGRLADAERLYRQVLSQQPQHAESLHLLGVVAHQSGRDAEAVELIRWAIGVNPGAAHYYSNLGSALARQGYFDEAIAAFRQAVSLQPNQPEMHANLGNALRSSGALDEAIESYQRAVRLRPEYVEAKSNLANALSDRGRIGEAIAEYRKLLTLRPASPDAFNNLGNALKDNGEIDAAIAAYRQAVAIKPDLAAAYSNLGQALRLAGQLDEAIAACRQAILLRPDLAEAYVNLGNALKETGQIDEAIASYRRAEELKPDARTAGNFLYAIHLHPDYDPAGIFQEHIRWNRTYARPFAASIRPHDNIHRASDRKLRIGYVSPDLRDHPAGRFMLPLLAHHDRQAFEIFCYAEVRRPDAMTERLRSRCDAWRSTVGLSDQQLADLIRHDRIDILVDLAMHTDGNRLLAFARKPAPIQATYLAYCSTTGLDAIDYRLTDPYVDPQGGDEGVYSERSIRLPRTYWCYLPRDEAPQVGPLPAHERGFVTFGCLNNYSKVTSPVLQAWGRLLRDVPGSRLLLHCGQGAHRQRALETLAREGVEPQRVEFVARVSIAQYLQTYARMNIALDPFPYAGGMTTCDALWMGVPVVSLAGRTAVSRAGLSILSNVGLSELAASDTADYIRIASDLARDLSRLAELRATMRDRMRASSLMDAPRFATDVERAYRQMYANIFPFS